jgi:dihydroflavonol-4-reductase
MTRPTLVTGANGHLGSNLCRLLAARGERVRAMMRASASPDALRDLDVEIVRGDILDAASTARAIAGCARVYHAAAGFVMWARDPARDIVAPSVTGTRHVVEAAAAADVEKLLYVSTTGTVGIATTPDRRLDESSHNAAPHTWYLQGKVAAEKEALAIAARTGLPLTIVNPAMILGPRFAKPSESVRQVADFVSQGAPFWFDGGFGMVDVEDVARGAIAAMDRGRTGERYILSGDDVTVRELFTTIGELVGLRPPRWRAPVPVVRTLAGIMEGVATLTGARPVLDRSQVDELFGKYGYFDSGKAVRELGYTWRPARDAIRRTVAWLLDRGFVAEKRLRLLRPDPSLRGAY